MIQKAFCDTTEFRRGRVQKLKRRWDTREQIFSARRAARGTALPFFPLELHPSVPRILFCPLKGHQSGHFIMFYLPGT